jgi:hypothetical protein
VSHVLSVNQAFTSPAKEDASKEETSILQGAVETGLDYGGWNSQQKAKFFAR